MTGTITTFTSRLEARTFLLLDAARKALICGRIKEARRRSGLTQEAVARRLGIGDRAYRNYEKNRVPKLSRLEALAEIFNVEGVDARWLQYGDEDSALEPSVAAQLAQLQADMNEQRAMTKRLLERLGEVFPPPPEQNDPEHLGPVG